MTLADLLNHWSLRENPFRGEEARRDDVFVRMSAENAGAAAEARAQAAAEIKAVADLLGDPQVSRVAAAAAGVKPIFHSDFEKILGDLRRPASAVVFGEKGSGKTAIRLQIAQRIGEYNRQNPGARVLLVAYDDLNSVLDRLHERLAGKSAAESLRSTRLVDHIDAILASVVPRVVDGILGRPAPSDPKDKTADPISEPLDLGAEKKPQRRLDLAARRELLILQALYDRPEGVARRTLRLRRRLGLWLPGLYLGNFALFAIGPALILAALIASIWFRPAWLDELYAAWGVAVLAGLYAVAAFKFGVWDRLKILRLAHKVRRQLRVIARGDISFARSLGQIPQAAREMNLLPVTDSDETRYALLERLRRVLLSFGYAGLIVVVDRVDEPTLVSGDAERMKAVIWPMLNNKFLQQDGLGIKLLLPVELRHALFKESSAFFQEARLDKQCMVERLGWSGPMLYDLCEARLLACTVTGAPPVRLLDLFAEDVTRQDLIECLERMHQPRDAFKMLYRCMTEHCANVAGSSPEWKIPRSTLMSVVKQEVDRLQQLYRGIRPA